MNIFKLIENLIESCMPATLTGFMVVAVILGLTLLALHLKEKGGNEMNKKEWVNNVLSTCPECRQKLDLTQKLPVTCSNCGMTVKRVRRLKILRGGNDG